MQQSANTMTKAVPGPRPHCCALLDGRSRVHLDIGGDGHGHLAVEGEEGERQEGEGPVDPELGCTCMLEYCLVQAQEWQKTRCRLPNRLVTLTHGPTKATT